MRCFSTSCEGDMCRNHQLRFMEVPDREPGNSTPSGVRDGMVSLIPCRITAQHSTAQQQHDLGLQVSQVVVIEREDIA